MDRRGLPTAANDGPTSSTIAMIERDTDKGSRLGWWYRLAAPKEPSLSASLKQREAYRRGKLISIALLMLIMVITIVLLTVGLFVNHALVPNLLGMLVMLSVAIFLNRRSNVLIAGILVVVGLDISLTLNFLAYPALSVFLLPFFDLLVLPELFAVSLLPPIAVFVDALFHVAFIVASLTFLLPQDAELKAILHTTSMQDALARPIVLQIAVAVISYLWVSSATQAIIRADRATTIAALERSMAEQAQLEADEKHQLEASVQQIIQVHTQVANGNFSSRVPVDQGNTLWEIAVSLNNLLARIQRFRQDSQRLQQLNNAIEYFFHLRNRSRNGAIPWQPTGTSIDTLVQQHNTYVQSAARAEQAHVSVQQSDQTPRNSF